MKTVVITGSTRGIGRGLADNFLARGCHHVCRRRTAGFGLFVRRFVEITDWVDSDDIGYWFQERPW